MKKTALFLVFTLFFLNCKKKKDETPVTEPEPIKTGSVGIKVVSYDSLGQVLTDNSGIRVKLDATHTATTDMQGSVVFPGLNYGTYYPTFVKDDFDSSPVQVSLSEPSVSVSFPVAARSPYRATNFTSQIVTKDSIPVNFTIDRALPAGKQIKIALLFSTLGEVTAQNYMSCDIFSIATSTITNYDVSSLPNFKAKLSALDSNTTFYIKVLPVSYGEYKGNLLPNPALLGENVYPPDKWMLLKNWKK
jgi:hypothetical protein